MPGFTPQHPASTGESRPARIASVEAEHLPTGRPARVPDGVVPAPVSWQGESWRGRHGTVPTGGRMIHHLIPARRRAGMAIVAVASLSLAGLAAGTSYAGGANAGRDPAQRSARASVGQSITDAYVDVTTESGPAQAQALRTAGRVTAQPASRQFQKAQPDGT